MIEEQKKPDKEKKPRLSYSRLEEKPLLANQQAIQAAVEYLNKRDTQYYKSLPEFEADKKFKDYYIQKYDREPTQDDIQEYVEGLINECIEEEKEAQKQEPETAKIETQLGEKITKNEKK